MSLYSSLYGRNPLSPFLRAMLKLDTEYATGRFRDIWLGGDGKTVILFTRNGGGNRECYCESVVNPAEGRPQKHESGCLAAVIESLQKHPQYLRDWDDQFDATYAHFEFRVPEEYLAATRLLATLTKPPKSLGDRFEETMDEVRKMTPEQFAKDPRFKGLVPVIEAITARIKQEAEK